MLFLKRLSDQFDVEFDKVKESYKKDGHDEDTIKILLQNHQFTFNVPESARWQNLRHYNTPRSQDNYL